MKDFKGVKVGDKLRCLTNEGWESSFEEGGVYTATELWSGLIGGDGIDLNGNPVSGMFAEDFELVEEGV